MGPSAWDRAMAMQARLGARHGLSAHDAAYLEPALRHGCPLVTLDDELRSAARAELVEVRPERGAR